MVGCLIVFLHEVIYMSLSFDILHHLHLAFLSVWDTLFTVVLGKF